MFRTTRFFQIIFLAALIPLISGCVAYKYTSTFFVRNYSPGTITVKTIEGTEGDPRNFDLPPMQQRSVHTESTRCPEGFVPIDKYTPEDPIPPLSMLGKLEIWVNGKQLDKDVCLRINWNRTETEYSEVYTLVIDEGLIERYGGK